MFLHRRSQLLLVGAVIVCIAMLSHVSGLSPGAATNIAGRQRMLSQRMTKAYLCLALNIRPQEAADELEKSRIQFESKLEILQASAFSPAVAEALKQEALSWQTFNAALSQPPTTATALAVLEQNTALLQACNTAVEQVVAFAVAHPETLADTLVASPQLLKDIAPLINISGRQRMLSQRMSVYYLAHLGQMQGTAFEEMLAAATLFRDSLHVLQNSPVTTPQIKQGLQAVEKEWLILFQEPSRTQNREITAEAFLTSTTQILTQMDQLTLAYQQLAY